MAGKLRQFLPRSARYVLRPNDRKVMRYSLEHSIGQGGIEQTLLVNLSETGVAFLINQGSEPHIGEHMKVEIPIPKGEQLAWWATVVRIQSYESSNWPFRKSNMSEEKKVLVGLRFDTLPEPHGRALRRGLDKSFLQTMREQQYRNWAYYRTLVVQNFAKIAIAILLTAFTIGFIYYFTLPDSKYDAKRGTQWGDRFKFF